MTAPTRPAISSMHLALYLPGAVFSTVAVLLLVFVGHVAVLSQLKYERTQQTAYAELRGTLANATTPVGQSDVDGELVPPGTPLALLRVPALDLSTVVLEGTTGEVLQGGPGHRRDTVLPGQLGLSVVMGRRAAYGAPFARLDKLLPGDEIEVTTGQGKHGYRVIAVRRAGEAAPGPSEAASGRLVLMTADGTPFAPRNVLAVYAELNSAAQPAPSRRFDVRSLPAPERPLATDPTAWTPLVLLGQALVFAALGLAWARVRWGTAQSWIVGIPVLTALGLAIADQAVRLLPNLL